MLRRILTSTLACMVCALVTDRAFAAETPKPRRHVVVVVWDGLRPDCVTETNTPELWKLAKAGVVFRNHHAVYPSSTEVNGVALATGVYPGHSGIIANREYRPEIDSRKPIDTENSSVVEKGDKLSGGNYVACSTIAELVRKTGRRTVIAAAKGVGLLQDRHVDYSLPGNAAPSASPFAKGEKIEVRGSRLRTSENSQTLTLPSPKPTPSPSLALARPSLHWEREGRGERTRRTIL